MQKINFVNNSEPAINAENLNKLQTNIENEINKAKVFAIGNITLEYASDTVLQKSVDITGLSNIAENKRVIMLTCRYVANTPTAQVNNLTYNTSANVLVVSANGTGFRSGHVLSVDYAIIQKS